MSHFALRLKVEKISVSYRILEKPPARIGIDTRFMASRAPLMGEPKTLLMLLNVLVIAFAETLS